MHVSMRGCVCRRGNWSSKMVPSQEEPAEEHYSDADYANYYWEQQNEWRERMEREEAERQARREEAFQRRREKERAAQVKRRKQLGESTSFYTIVYTPTCILCDVVQRTKLLVLCMNLLFGHSSFIDGVILLVKPAVSIFSRCCLLLWSISCTGGRDS